MQRGLLKWQSNKESSKMKYDKVLIFKREKTKVQCCLKIKTHTHSMFSYFVFISVQLSRITDSRVHSELTSSFSSTPGSYIIFQSSAGSCKPLITSLTSYLMSFLSRFIFNTEGKRFVTQNFTQCKGVYISSLSLISLIFFTHFFEILSVITLILIFRTDISNSVRMGLYKSVVKETQGLN